jgi:hypothetical protein
MSGNSQVLYVNHLEKNVKNPQIKKITSFTVLLYLQVIHFQRPGSGYALFFIGHYICAWGLIGQPSHDFVLTNEKPDLYKPT